MCCIVSQAVRDKSAIVRCQLTGLLTHAQPRTQDRSLRRNYLSVSTRIITSQQQSDASSPALPTMPDQEHRARKSSSKLPSSSLNGACAPPACFSEMAFSLSAALKTKSATAQCQLTDLACAQPGTQGKGARLKETSSLNQRGATTDLMHLLLQDGLLPVSQTRNKSATVRCQLTDPTPSHPKLQGKGRPHQGICLSRSASSPN